MGRMLALMVLTLLTGCTSSEAPGPGGLGGAGPVLSYCSTLATNDCQPCLFNVECGSGNLCQQGVCMPRLACESAMSCSEAAPACTPLGFCGQCATNADCGNVGACAGGQCAATCETNDSCPEHTHCDPGLHACVQCSDDSDCPKSLSCKNFRCEGDVCTPGQARCETGLNATLTCNDAGSREVPFFCPEGKHCSDPGDGKAQCAKEICAPNSGSCDADGVTLVRCDNTGLKTQALDCSKEDGACLNGACVGVVCKPGERKCSGGTVIECSWNGTELLPVDTCSPQEHCDEGSKSCELDTCSAGEAVCDGNRKTVCADDGSVPQDGGTDCEEDDKICIGGECREILCQSDYFCENGDVYRCADQGTTVTLHDDCNTSEYCTSGMSTCQPTVCPPNQKYCDENEALECNTEGSGTIGEGMSCGDDICINGECVPVVCERGTSTCRDNKIYSCSYSGTQEFLTTTCAENQYCSSGSTSCLPDQCVASQTSCQGNSLVACDSEGKWIPSSAEPCGERVCSGGVCKDKICSGYHCGEDGNVHSCTSDGLYSYVYDVCGANEYCIDGNSSCAAQSCTPGAPMCSNNSVTSCAPNGSGPIPGGVSCGSDYCEAGECKPVICTPGYACNGSTLTYCPYPGTQLSAVATCSASQYCDANSRGCKTKVCEPNTSYCSANTVQTCDDRGAGPINAGTPCTGRSCVGGVCKDQICIPTQVRCGEGKLQTCAQNATEWIPTDCPNGQVCNDGNTACSAPLCAPGEPYCYYSFVMTCNSGGYGPADPDGMLCGPQQYCIDGACVDASEVSQ